MSRTQPLTANQSKVLATLSRSEAPMGAYALLDELRGDGFRAPLQVYRALDKLQEFGLVHRLECLNAFVACAHPHDHDSALVAFAICEQCGRVEEFSDETVEERLGAWARGHAFSPHKTTIEIRGRCRDCAPA